MGRWIMTTGIWFILFFSSFPARAFIIVDTGHPDYISSGGGGLYYLGGPFMDGDVEILGQSLAGYFEVSQSYVLTDIEG